tara:strand:- start:7826 stop:8836 length:1011 start_codon:yes stop_codon:yes gene_type:complete
MSDNSKELLKSFILDIIKVFPEYEKRLKKQYSKVLSGEDNCEELLSSFYENVEEIAKDLSENNFSVLESDPIILNNVSFKLIWNSNISNETKNNIWRYLQTFCVYNINNKQGKEDVEDVLNSIKQKEKVSDKGTLTNMKLLKKLSESLNSNIVMELLTNKKVETPEKKEVKNVKIGEKIEGMKGMEDLLENSSIGKIAKEVSEELDIESMIKGGEGIESLMNGDNMMNIFKSISQKIDNNEDGNIMEEAMDLSKNMKDNPLFSSLMSTMGQGLSQMDNPANMMAAATAAQQQAQPTHPDNRKINLSNTHDGSATRKRLQKKLQERNEGKVDVNKKD